ncbi:MAG: hypothetical protein A2381_08500 [Bdellovibrionales bacterium RIFOXYB1_FULL_37_110]|nr:MAG: hypothetical protein A2417_14175 [Bdellovibrionales bacterium RIFOXYC1_FULL_37_79]OFZ58246.1 MAG: hypothetical protein A2381_08500 [Bdellovibrionales bacterium RIFOXYB1_FULL_37_110]OFZ65543.1 MAG: hypothetical protein A2577_08250 [Bdellovibrionales bacterium RIFOXYD1_FULL_36_51]
MKLRQLWLCFVIVFSTQICASLPATIPTNCFQEDLICSSSQVVSKVIEGIKEKVININIFALLSKEDYSDYNQIIKIFYDFNAWEKAILKTGTNKVKIKKSLQLESIMVGDGTVIYRQYLNYSVKGPSPLFYVPARAVGHYWQIPSPEEVLYSGEFMHLNKGVFEIPGEDVLTGSVGYRYHAGDYHVTEDLQNYYLHFRAFIIPDIEYLHEALAVFIEDGYKAILKGLYFF